MNRQGNYTVRFDAQTQEGERIYCLTAEFYLTTREGVENKRLGLTENSHRDAKEDVIRKMLLG